MIGREGFSDWHFEGLSRSIFDLLILCVKIVLKVYVGLERSGTGNYERFMSHASHYEEFYRLKTEVISFLFCCQVETYPKVEAQ